MRELSARDVTGLRLPPVDPSKSKSIRLLNFTSRISASFFFFFLFIRSNFHNNSAQSNKTIVSRLFAPLFFSVFAKNDNSPTSWHASCCTSNVRKKKKKERKKERKRRQKRTAPYYAELIILFVNYVNA